MLEQKLKEELTIKNFFNSERYPKRRLHQVQLPASNFLSKKGINESGNKHLVQEIPPKISVKFCEIERKCEILKYSVKDCANYSEKYLTKFFYKGVCFYIYSEPSST